VNSDSALIEARNISVRVGRKLLLENVSLTISKDEIVTVIGPNGGGKTTLLRALVGAIPLSSGVVIKSPQLRIGYAPQRMLIEASMPVSVDRFLALAGSNTKADRTNVLEGTDTLRLRQTTMASLSGGETQRVLIARALLRNPNLLILDEPTQGLDQQGEEHFYSLLRGIRAESGTAVLMVSHDLHVVMAGSDRVICLNGHVCCSGAPETVSVDPKYLNLFGSRANLALYQHHHDHSHDGHEHG
jgi:zinc transport system ATP-binding protein